MADVSPLGAMFGGCLDNAHGYRLGPKQETQLKFLALFSDHIIVPDTFFHCYGPIYNKAREFANDSKIYSSHPAVKSDLLMRLIGEGVIRPALRDKKAIQNSSLVDNFSSIEEDHGIYLFPPTKEGTHVLRFLDEIRKTHLDKTLPQWEGSHSLSTLRALEHRLLKLDFAEIKEEFITSFGKDMKEADNWVREYDFVTASMHKQRGYKYFRRGPVEEAIAQTLGIGYEFVYEELSEIRRRDRTPKEQVLLYLHDEMLFCYQMCQGSSLKTVPSITHMLPNKTFNDETLRQAIGSSVPNGKSAAITFNLDIDESVLDSLTTDELMNLRNGAFKNYREDISNILALPVGDLDAQFRFATSTYKRKIAEKIGDTNSTLFNNIVLGVSSLAAGTGWAVLVRLVFQRNSQSPIKYLTTNYYDRKMGPGYNNFLISKD